MKTVQTGSFTDFAGKNRMIKRVYGAHPIMILKFIKPFLFVLILPVAKGALQHLATGKITGVLLLELFAAVSVALLSIFSFKAFAVSINDNLMVIKSGLFLKREAVICRERLSCVTAVRGPADAIFGSVTYKINTEAGRNKKTDFSFKLRKTDAEELFVFLYGGENRTKTQFPASKTAIFAAASSSVATGILVGLPITNNLGKLLGVALNRILFDEISRASSRFNTYFPPVVNLITALLFVAYTVSFLITFIKMLKFRLKAGEEKLETEYGFIYRRHVVFKKQAVNDVCIEQSPIMRAAGLFSMRAAVGGYGDNRGEKAIIIPAARRKTINEQLQTHFSFLYTDKGGIKAERSKSTKNRFLWQARLYAALDLIAFAVLSTVFRSGFALLALSGIVILAVIVYYGNLCYRNYKFGKLVIGDQVCAIGSKGLLVRELYCQKERVGEIKLTRTPIDRIKDTCKAEIVIRSESADKVRVCNIDYEKTIDMIKTAYNSDE